MQAFYTLSQVSAFTTFLCNISMIINTYASKLHLFNRMKKVQITCFEPLLLTHHYFFYTQPKIEILRGFCIAKDMNVPRMITLNKNFARWHNYFRMERRYKHFPYWISVQCLLSFLRNSSDIIWNVMFWWKQWLGTDISLFIVRLVWFMYNSCLFYIAYFFISIFSFPFVYLLVVDMLRL